ncbi:hypothetical protein CANARDRAFT_26989 [[Candida] arabinofermentans NRRL YB-2248]|uniref:HTH APSES-type domain-containing protein n=1 Tax=[Candida] arabinofermentans NRRL YB-2248 TaxID=983967 RepID=A0A1E4T795_9ASCO|nr:hypothetical protein CANARDRAFT_26989 [[Candida] arabinofermentans NRRL YB-2248]
MESVVENNHKANDSMMSIDSINESFGSNGVFTYHVTPVYRVSYSNNDVIEMEVNSCPIMRRLKDSYFNATQILKVVGLDRSKRSRMLENDIYQGTHEKVQGGSGKYQGTWIPYERTVALCRQYEIYEVLKPLLLFNPTVNSEETPTKEQLTRTYSSLTEEDGDTNNHSNNNNHNGFSNSTNGHHGNGYGSQLSHPEEVGDDGLIQSPKRQKTFSKDLPALTIYDHDTKVANPNAPFTIKPLQESPSDEKSKVVMSSLFLPNQNDLTLLELVGGDETQLEGIQIDLPIDDNGQTALHLAATLGRISLVKDLVSRGANRIRGDIDGQTALIRAVHATNCFEFGCFDQLLDFLYPAITVLDHKGRTVLHHIAYTCGRKGRNDACKYYLETLLEWVVKRGPFLPGNQNLSLTIFMQDVVNIPDRNGDTCLNIAAMVGNKHIIQQLLEVGADPNKANKAGVKPIDCGINIKPFARFNDGSSESRHQRLPSSLAAAYSAAQASSTKDSSSSSPSSVAAATAAGSFSKTKNSSKILESIQTFVNQLGRDFNEEIEQKSKQIDEMHPKLREKTLKLSEKRKQYEELQKVVRKISDYKTKIMNLNNAIHEEEQKFIEQTKELPLTSKNFDGDFDADEPFTVWSVYHEVENKIEEMKAAHKTESMDLASATAPLSSVTKEHDENTEAADSLLKLEPSVADLLANLKPEQLLTSQQQEELPPSVVLEARINAYTQNNKKLIERTKSRRSSSQELEQQFKRVIGLCIGSSADDIDEKLLASLLLSVENDPDPEINQIKKVLKIVNDLDK